MIFQFLPKNIISALDNVDYNKLYEIRIRKNFPIKIRTFSGIFYLCEQGQTINKNKAIICTISDINIIIDNLTSKSIYAFNDKIKQGYLTYKGIRIGICGECVFDKNSIVTIKNFSSLNIRIPHNVDNCSEKIIKYLFDGVNICNTLIISPPFYGKTTILKDIARNLNKLNCYSILIVDERGEFESVEGENFDIILYSNKSYAFSYGIRSMAPDVIITDELSSKEDWECVKKASDSGVTVLASCHGGSIFDVKSNKNFIDNVFERYVVLSNDGQPGIVDMIYNGDFNKI